MKEEKNKMEKTELHKIKTMKIKKDRKNKVNLSTLLVSLPAAAHQTLTSTFFELMLKILYRHNFLRIDWEGGIELVLFNIICPKIKPITDI